MGEREAVSHRGERERLSGPLTVLAAGAVEAGRTVAQLGGALPTLASVEAHAVATHRCGADRQTVSQSVGRTDRQTDKLSLTPYRAHAHECY